ncbi:MAG: GntR family transcriptional regulator [Candidatus Fimenecus sp.]
MTYRQLSDDIKRDIVSGNWSLKQKLPSAKELAEQYDVNANTVKRALSNLQKEGLIDSKRTTGKYITGNEILISSIRENEARKLANDFVNKLGDIGIRPEELAMMFKNPEIPYLE